VSTRQELSIVVATYRREAVLVETLDRLLALAPPPLEIVVVDQTPRHEPETEARLTAWGAAGAIRWLRRAAPSIPGAMNDGLLVAQGARVLFLDDDVIPVPELAARHLEAAARTGAAIVAGQVLQPGERAEPLSGAAFGFRSSIAQPASEVIGANFSVDRETALVVGGFDENFVEVAYRYEADFCDRVRAAGGAIWFEPAASVRHLRAGAGGTRAWGDHLRTFRSSHAVGEYYYWLLSGRPGRWRRILVRPFRAVRTRHHLTHPWWIPATVAAEIGGWLRAAALARGGRRLLRGADGELVR
jgi:GT2 family glycosyltransferase